MKLIEAMKKVKDLTKKAEDLRGKIATYHADLDIETPPYGDRQKEQVSEWLQAHGDVVQEIENLQVAVQRTNLATSVTIELGKNKVTKTIAAWIHRRRTLAALDLAAWSGMNDRGLREGTVPSTIPGAEARKVSIRRHYDPRIRDERKEIYRSEPSIIDGTLEVVNATTELIG